MNDDITIEFKAEYYGIKSTPSIPLDELLNYYEQTYSHTYESYNENSEERE